MENKQEILTAICEALKKTRNAEDLDRIEYVKKNGDEYARPIFKDGNGNNGYYDVNISGDSGTSIFADITRQFVSKVW